MDKKKALRKAEKLLKKIEVDVDKVPMKGQEFAQSVLQLSTEIVQFIREHNYGTSLQLQALQNMHTGVKAWIREKKKK